MDKKAGLHYTDIDYSVFSDGSRYVYQGLSPYKRSTYRYTPLLAYLLLGNSYFGENFGKFLFVLFDSFTGIFIRRLIKSNLTRKQIILSYLLWDFNPFVINISTRGNSDSLICFLLVFVLYLMKNNHIVLSAIFYGISVHLRLFPIYFVFTFFFYYKFNVFKFGFIAGFVFMGLNIIFYVKYGNEFLTETFLYHLKRKDYKHNFSSTWLSNYFELDPTKSFSICRILLVIFLSYYYQNNIELSWTSIIVCFIGFNPVCTVQYFDWAFALMATIPQYLVNKRFVVSVLIWVIAHIFWLLVAFLLEFKGINVFIPLWIISVMIFISSNILLSSLIQKKYRNINNVKKYN